MDYAELFADLAERYAVMQSGKAVVRAAVRAKYQPIIQAEIAAESEKIEREFAVHFVSARNGGMPRHLLSDVLKTSDGGKFRKFVELGGGKIREQLTPQERAKVEFEKEKLRIERNRANKKLREEEKERDRAAEEAANAPMTAEEREAVFAAAGLVETHEGGMWWPEGEREVRFRLFEGVPRLSFLAYTTFATSERERLIEHDNAHRDELVVLHELIESEKSK